VVRATVRHWQGRHRDAVRECHAAVELATRAQALDVLAEALVWQDVSELMLGRGDGSDAREAEAILRGLGDQPWQLGRCLNELGIRAWYAGDWDGARRCYEQCRASFAEAGDAWAVALAQANEAEILVEQGRLAEAEPLLRSALRAGRASAAPGHTAFVLGLLGRLDLRADRPEAGLEHLVEARQVYEGIGEPEEALETRLRIAEGRVLAGDPAGALADLDSLGDVAQSPLLLRVRGLALHLTGQAVAARQALDEALSLARSRGSDHEVTLALAALAWWHGHQGGALAPELAVVQQALRDRLGIVAITLPRGATRTIPRPREARDGARAPA
jgi:tetratricopeptide (TPR) repeat protein